MIEISAASQQAPKMLHTARAVFPHGDVVPD
jgi:hypothetical protein